MNNLKSKEFKNYQEQIQILNQKGLITDDNSINILRRNNYYFLINRYRDLFTTPNKKPKEFIEGTHFNEIVGVYNFDRDLRVLLLKYIITIENTIKSLISYWFAHAYGNDYTNKVVFDTNNNDPKRVKLINNLISTILSTIKKSSRENKYVKHYYENYQEVPIWVIINDLSLSSISKFYSLMYEKDQNNVASEFNIKGYELDKYLKVLTYFRNLSAHNQRIFDQKSSERINNTKLHLELIPGRENNIYGKNDILAVIIIFKILLEDHDYQDFIKELNNIIKKLDDDVNTIDVEIILKMMGLNLNLIKNL